jgi:hypothetical protein
VDHEGAGRVRFAKTRFARLICGLGRPWDRSRDAAIKKSSLSNSDVARVADRQLSRMI